jgi:hypothetical protein
MPRMYTNSRISMKYKNYINNSSLVLLTFSSIFYVRIVSTTIRFSLLNLLHFILVPAVCIYVLSTTRIRDSKQIALCTSFLLGLLLLFGITIVSALWNHAGLINAISSFMMLGEPFMFLLAMICLPISTQILMKMKNFLYWSVAINFFLALIQKPLIDSGRLNAQGLDGTDGCGGVFFLSTAGGYVSASVSLTFSMYFFRDRTQPLWLRVLVVLAALWQLLFSDSKQLILAYGVGWILTIFFDTKNIVKTLKLVIGLALILSIGIWLVMNVEEFKSFTAWARPELYGSNGDAWHAKFFPIRLILKHYQSSMNGLLGMGPGHTVSRLGGWFLKDYDAILGPLGSTATTIGQQTTEFSQSFWLTGGSTMFSPFWGWVGIWGDLGLLGLGAYLYLAYLAWRHFCWNDILKATLLNVFVLGFVFTQMEEPGYMIFIAFVLGLSWQERQLQKQVAQNVGWNERTIVG